MNAHLLVRAGLRSLRSLRGPGLQLPEAEPRARAAVVRVSIDVQDAVAGARHHRRVRVLRRELQQQADEGLEPGPAPLHVGIVYKSFTSGVKVAPQNCNFKGCGAYTGEMAADQMKDMGIEWCLIGHSERRGEFGLPTPAESSELRRDRRAEALARLEAMGAGSF